MTEPSTLKNRDNADLIAKARMAMAGGRLLAPVVVSLKDEFSLSDEQLLTALIPLAAEFAGPALSNFSVGATARGESGAVYIGANLEFDGSGLNRTVHAEQAVVVNAATHAEKGLSKIAVSAPPCGHCRQFLYELVNSDDLQIVQPGGRSRKLPYYLPEPFGPEQLDNSDRILASTPHELDFVNESDSRHPAANEVLRCARASYAPYSGAVAAAAVQTSDNKIFAAPYLENVAFNPSLPPLQGAIINAAISGYKPSEFRMVVIVQQIDSAIQHQKSAESLLATACPDIPMQTIWIRAQ